MSDVYVKTVTIAIPKTVAQAGEYDALVECRAVRYEAIEHGATAGEAAESATASALAAQEYAAQAAAAAALVPSVGTDPDEVPTNATADAAYAPLSHASDTANPHAVTKAQVGLGNVANAAQVQLAAITAAGDLLYGTGAGTVSRLAAGYDGQVLTLGGGLPTWSDATGGGSGWIAMAAGDYTALPASTSTVTMGTDYTSTLYPGAAIRFKVGLDYRYALVSAITASLLTIAGEPLPSSPTTISDLSYSTSQPVQFDVVVPGYWATAAETSMLLNEVLLPLAWQGPPAKIVQLFGRSRTVDTGTNKERLNVRRGDTTTDYVCTSNSGQGIEMTVAATRYSTGVDIDPAKNTVSRGDRIELKAAGNGSNKDSSDLHATIIFVVK